MEVTDELVDKLATLSGLRFEGERKEAIKSDLEKMIGFVNKLAELDTAGIEPLTHMTENVSVTRKDIVGNMLTNAEALAPAQRSSLNAPRSPYFTVPKVIKK